MTNMSKTFPWMTRQIDRRSFLNRTSSTTFGVLAGLAVGVRPSQVTPNVFPCFGLPDCRSFSTRFCSGHSCVCNRAQNFCCQNLNGICPHQVTANCWSSNGHRCCDCSCSWCSPCNSADCICYG
jgi:hypothetical protein